MKLCLQRVGKAEKKKELSQVSSTFFGGGVLKWFRILLTNHSVNVLKLIELYFLMHQFYGIWIVHHSRMLHESYLNKAVLKPKEYA